MYQVLHGLDFSYVYINDVLVTSRTPEKHKLHLRMILECFHLYGILINPTKCVRCGWTAVPETPRQPAWSVPTWGPSTGHARVSKAYNHTSTMGVPWHSELFHWFVPQCAQILTPLNSMLKTTPSNSRILQWTSEATAAFQDIKNALADASLLVHPKPDAPVKLMTDASDIAIGGVLQQYLNDMWCPLAYFSRKLTLTEQKYSTYDRELLAVYSAICHFRHFLEAHGFCVLTDHKPLSYNLNSKPYKHSPWQVRQLDFISQFTSHQTCHWIR